MNFAIKSVLVFSCLALSSPLFADSTPWFDRDNPGGVGDYETTRHLLSIECRFKGGNAPISENSPAGYHCNIAEGGWCKNNNPAGLACQDMEVKFKYYNGGSTPWLDRDDPGGVGDYETIRDLLTIKCKFVNGGIITEGSPTGYHCNIPDGGWCKNNNPAGLACKDMKVKFFF